MCGLGGVVLRIDLLAQKGALQGPAGLAGFLGTQVVGQDGIVEQKIGDGEVRRCGRYVVFARVWLGALIATEKASRTNIPLEYVLTG